MDTINWSLTRRQLQQEADAAAVSGANASSQSANVSAAANYEISAMSKVTLTGSPSVENPPASGIYAGDTTVVRVKLASAQRLAFSSLFLSTPPTINVQATAKIISTGTFCVLALGKSSTTGISVSGSSSATLGCGMATNSTGSSAINGTGSSSIDVTTLTAVGSIPASTNFGSNTKLYPHSIPQIDPFRALPQPSVSGCQVNQKVNSNQIKTLYPGCYSGLTINGTANLQPGTYFIDGTGGGFSIGSQAVLNGSDVTFVLTSSSASSAPSTIAHLSVNGGATLNLRASSSGTYAGVLFFQDRLALDSGTNQMNGNATSTLQGAIYFPRQELQYSGTSGMQTDCLQIVGLRVTFTGNTTISNNCPANSGANAFSGVVIRLVG